MSEVFAEAIEQRLPVSRCQQCDSNEMFVMHADETEMGQQRIQSTPCQLRPLPGVAVERDQRSTQSPMVGQQAITAGHVTQVTGSEAAVNLYFHDAPRRIRGEAHAWRYVAC